MSGNNPPSAAATARALDANQNLKRSVQSAFDGKSNFSSSCWHQQCLISEQKRAYSYISFPRESSNMGSLFDDGWGLDSSPGFDISIPGISFVGAESFSNNFSLIQAGFLTSSIPEPQDTKKSSLDGNYRSKVRVSDRYKIVGFISSGTYGRVYKAIGHNGQSGEFAIKKSDEQ